MFVSTFFQSICFDFFEYDGWFKYPDMTPYYTNGNVAMDIRVICIEIYSSLDVYSWT